MLTKEKAREQPWLPTYFCKATLLFLLYGQKAEAVQAGPVAKSYLHNFHRFFSHGMKTSRIVENS